jgi:LmbE family N-acetylglucosaminyl deacetylase
VFELKIGALRSILCLGAHCDDIEIGAGATVLKLAAEYPGLHVDWVVFSSTPERAAEARACAGELLAAAGSSAVAVHAFTDGFFPAEIKAIKQEFEALAARVSPDVILTHHRRDRHQDHRVVADLTWNTFRNHLVLEYEVPKYEGDLGQPNVFVPVDDRRRTMKVEALVRHYGSQAVRPWFTADTFNALMRIRGIECRSASGYAEAFHGSKLVLGG